MNSIKSNRALLESTPKRFQQTYTLFAIAVFCCIFFTGCDTTASVAKFSTSAQTTLSSGTPIFEDLSASCSREVADHTPAGQFVANPAISPDCEEVADRVKGIEEVSQVLSAYFGTLNSLASFNTATTSTDMGKLASNASDLAKLNSDRKNALQSLAQIITQITSSSYQAKHLRDDIVNANPHIQSVIATLQEAVGKGSYLNLLAKEQGALKIRNEEFIRTNPGSPESILLLDHQWKTDSDALNAKERSANAYIAALALIGKGHKDLAEKAPKVDAKQMLALLNPYIDQIQPLIATIQKAF
jgi:hypothetical protein